MGAARVLIIALIVVEAVAVMPFSCFAPSSLVSTPDAPALNIGVPMLFQGDYDNNSTCETDITAPEGMSLRITIERLDIQEGHDFVYIFEKPFVFGGSVHQPSALAESVMLARMTGSPAVLPSPITSASNGITIIFQSDEAIVGTGFVFHVTAVNNTLSSVPCVTQPPAETCPGCPTAAPTCSMCSATSFAYCTDCALTFAPPALMPVSGKCTCGAGCCPKGMFYLDAACYYCTPGCNACSDTTGYCTECADGGWAHDAIWCQPCTVPHCTSCVSATGLCEACDSGYVLASDGTCQLPCGAHCSTCAGADTCAACEVGYTLRGGACMPDGCVSNCAICGDSGCETCATGSYLVGGACVPCVSPCATCSAERVCTSCVAGASLAANGQCALVARTSSPPPAPAVSTGSAAGPLLAVLFLLGNGVVAATVAMCLRQYGTVDNNPPTITPSKREKGYVARMPTIESVTTASPRARIAYWACAVVFSIGMALSVFACFSDSCSGHNFVAGIGMMSIVPWLVVAVRLRGWKRNPPEPKGGYDVLNMFGDGPGLEAMSPAGGGVSSGGELSELSEEGGSGVGRSGEGETSELDADLGDGVDGSGGAQGDLDDEKSDDQLLVRRSADIKA